MHLWCLLKNILNQLFFFFRINFLNILDGRKQILSKLFNLPWCMRDSFNFFFHIFGNLQVLKNIFCHFLYLNRR